ncbi:MAG: HlyD family efflux transporter periplasmic adaptor subunit [Clostridia bacterium]|nr:HlyD family efflux transporter periplasmic adaptor subunit [Clostridia bacterium]
MIRAVKILLVLALVGAVGYFGTQYFLPGKEPEDRAESAAAPYRQVSVGRGDINKVVTGTGSLNINKTEDIMLPYAITVTDTIVAVGDRVDREQALMRIDHEALQDTIDALQSELDACESDMAAISNSYKTTAYVTTPVTGIVKEVYVEAGQRVEDVMRTKGAIALLSLDGKMVVEIDAVDGMQVTADVKVKAGRSNLNGVVRELNDGKAKITFLDTAAADGEEVEVFYDKQSVGTAPAYINLPYLLTTTDKGYVSTVFMVENHKRFRKNRCLYLIDVPVSDEYGTLLAKRDRLIRQIAGAKVILASDVVVSPIDGIVSVLVDATNTVQDAQTLLASLYVGDQKEMVVKVDELDIIHLREGQSAVIQMDALPEQAYRGTVEHVSHVGTPDGGVTVYDVTIKIDTDKDDPLRIGMNGTASIMVQNERDVLLVPISALNSSRDGQYVWLYDPDSAAAEDEPGVRTFVATGMANEDFAQVLSGLREGDVVLITREANVDQGRRFMQNMGGGVMFQERVPSQGGGTRPGGQGGN